MTYPPRLTSSSQSACAAEPKAMSGRNTANVNSDRRLNMGFLPFLPRSAPPHALASPKTAGFIDVLRETPQCSRKVLTAGFIFSLDILRSADQARTSAGSIGSHPLRRQAGGAGCRAQAVAHP